MRYGEVAGALVVANDAESEDRRFTHLLDRGGRLLGEVADGVDDPAVVESAGAVFVIGDSRRIVAFRVSGD